MGSMLGPSRVIAKDVKSCTYCCYVRCATLIVWVGGMPWPQTGATQYHTQLGLPDKGCAIKERAVCNNWDVKPLDLLNGLALGWHQLSPEWGMICVKHVWNFLYNQYFVCDLTFNINYISFVLIWFVINFIIPFYCPNGPRCLLLWV